MKPLKEYIKLQSLSGKTDMEIIQDYLVDNSLESVALSIIPTLAQRQLDKVQCRLNYAQSHIPLMFTMPLRGLDKDTQYNLVMIEQCCALSIDFEKAYPSIFEWAKKTIPTLELPECFFMPTLNYLAKWDIYFKDREHLGKKQHLLDDKWWEN